MTRTKHPWPLVREYVRKGAAGISDAKALADAKADVDDLIAAGPFNTDEALKALAHPPYMAARHYNAILTLYQCGALVPTYGPKTAERLLDLMLFCGRTCAYAVITAADAHARNGERDTPLKKRNAMILDFYDKTSAGLAAPERRLAAHDALKRDAAATGAGIDTPLGQAAALDADAFRQVINRRPAHQ